MNEEDLELIRNFIDGKHDSSMSAKVNKLLKSNSEARKTFRDLALLNEGLQNWSLTTIKSKSPKEPLFFKPLSAAAAGLLVGILLTSFMNLYLSASSYISTIVKILDESFEDTQFPKSDGFPTNFKDWSGDYNKITFQDQNINPAHGNKMLKVLSSDYSGKQNEPGYIGDIYRVIDLTNYKSFITTGKTRARISIKVNNISYGEQHELYNNISLISYNILKREMDIDDRQNFLDPKEVYINGTASSQKRILLNRQGNIWMSNGCSLDLPKDTKFLIVHISFLDLKQRARTATTYFEGSYLDSIQLTLEDIVQFE